jgi:hypothetical protein
LAESRNSQNAFWRLLVVAKAGQSFTVGILVAVAKKLFNAKPTWIKNTTDFFESVAPMVHTVSILS